MAISYNGLLKLVIDKNMYKKDLTEKLGISSATIAKMGKGETVSVEVLQNICWGNIVKKHLGKKSRIYSKFPRCKGR